MDPREVLIPAVREALAGLRLTEPERDERLLLRTAERTGSPREAELFLTCLGAAVAEAADPESALLHLERWSALLPTPSSTLRLLREDPRLLADLLDGRPGPIRDAVLLNAGAALWVADAVESLAEGVLRAAESLDSGAARTRLERLVALTRAGVAA